MVKLGAQIMGEVISKPQAESPEYREYLEKEAERKQTISKIQSDLSQAKLRLQYLEIENKAEIKRLQETNAPSALFGKLSTTYLEKRTPQEAKIRALSEALSTAGKSYVKYEDVKTYVSAKVEATDPKYERMRLKYVELIKKIPAKELPPVTRKAVESKVYEQVITGLRMSAIESPGLGWKTVRLTPVEQARERFILKAETAPPAPTKIKSIEPYKMVTPIELTKLEATKQAIARIKEGFKMSASGLILDLDPTTGMEYILDPFKYTGKIKAETIAGYETPKKVTITETTIPGTPYTYEQMKFKGIEFPEDIYLRTGATIPYVAPTIIETGALIGATAFGGPVGTTLVSSYLIATGEKDVIEADTKLRKLLGVARVGIGLGGFARATRLLKQDITLTQIKETLEKKPTYYLGTREDLGEGIVKDVYFSKDRIYGTQVMRSAETISKQIGEKAYKISGAGEVYVKSYPFLEIEKPILFGARTTFKGIGVPVGEATWQPSLVYGRFGKEWEFSIKALKKDFSKIAGQAEIWKNMKYEKALLAGISKREEDIIKSVTGKVTKISPTWKTPSGIIISPLKTEFFIEDVAMLKVLNQDKELVKYILGSGKAKTEFVAPTQLIKQLTQPVIKPPSIKFPTGILATPITKIKQKPKAISKFRMENILRDADSITKRALSASSSAIKTKVKQKEKAITLTKQVERELARQSERQRTALYSALKLPTKEKLKQQFRFKFKPPTITETPKFPRFPIPIISPPIIPFYFPLPKKKPKKKLRKGKKRIKGLGFGYSPTLIMRMVGLPELKVSQREAEKLVKRSLTGFELRPGLIIGKARKRRKVKGGRKRR